MRRYRNTRGKVTTGGCDKQQCCISMFKQELQNLCQSLYVGQNLYNIELSRDDIFITYTII